MWACMCPTVHRSARRWGYDNTILVIGGEVGAVGPQQVHGWWSEIVKIFSNPMHKVELYFQIPLPLIFIS